MADQHHVTIIGAGIIGVCAGLALLRDGHDVTIIDRDGVAENCSFGNAGVICQTDSSMPLPYPGILRDVPKMLMDRRRYLTIRWGYMPTLLPWMLAFLKSANAEVREANARAMYALLDGTISSYEALTKGTPGERLIRKNGTLVIYKTDEGYDGDADDRAFLENLGANSQHLASEELRQMEPCLSPDLRHATYFPESYSTTNPYKLTCAIGDQFVAEGGKIELVEVTGMRHGAGRVSDIETTAGDRKVDRLLVAAGAWSHRVAAMMGLKVLLDTERGYHTVLHGVDTGLTRPLIHAEDHYGLNQMDEGVRFAGTVELAGVDAAPNYERADIVYEKGRTAFRDFDPSGATKVTKWMGRRPTMPDYLPALGPASGFSNVWFDFGHQHLGLSLAARSGMVVSDLISGRDPGLDLHAFRPERF